jgi:dimethylargininase
MTGRGCPSMCRGNSYTGGLVRPPGDSFERAIRTRQARIDPALARAQHAEYCSALRSAGFKVEALPADEDNPDSCFVQDPAIVVAGHGILCRMGTESRAAEPEGISAWLDARFPVSRIEAPGTLEGGDVAVLADRVLVGQSGRTNAAGIAQLRRILEPLGIAVTALPVAGHLHLLTGVSYVGHNTMLALAAYASHPAILGFDVLPVPPEEAEAANALGNGARVILSAGNPRTAAALRTRGFEVLETPMSAFAAADGGVTCLSLVW